MKQKFLQFMYGRYGTDALSKFLTCAGFVVLIVSMLLPGIAKTLTVLLAVLLIVFTYYRTFSKKLEKRRAENGKYLALRRRFTDAWKLRRDMWKQRKTYKFFKCPSCRAVLRVPKGKGRLRVVCKKCGAAFEKRT
ncbi:MAG: hypothetical protein LBL15_04535 [Oscillospiraceae bacterium]|jgi:hypothetical protein|nr:hypothetical protein [Oscillospiraceae bacterium]